MNFIKLFSIDILNTLRINFRLPIKQAIKLPIWVYNCKIDSIKGKIILDTEKVSTGMIRLGLRTSILNTSKYGIGLSLLRDSSLTFKGPGYMGTNCAIEISHKGKIIFGKNFGITASFKIASRKSIIIGDNFSSSWEVNIFDTDFHSIYNISKDCYEEYSKNVYIGNDVWVCQHVTILKGSFIPDRSIITSNSLVNKSFYGYPLNSIYGGLPAKFIKTGYTRKEFKEFETSPMENIVKYLKL